MTGRHGRWNAQRLVWAAVMSMAAVCAGLALGGASSGAATSGWYVATTPGTGADDIALGSSCANAELCMAVGISIQNIASDESFAPLVESWNGSSWSLGPQAPVPPGDGGGLFAVSCVNGADCWAVGAVLGVAGNGNPSATLIENWNGASWSIVPSPTPTGPDVEGAVLQGVHCVSATSCVAVGFSTDDSGANLHAVIEQWNGAAWTLVPAADTGQAFEQLSGVTCAATSDCWAVGNAGAVQQNPNFLPIFPGAVGDQGLIEHWDGSSWTVVPSTTEPSPSGGFLYGVTCTDAANCWASGATTDTSGMASGLLLQHWNGSKLVRFVELRSGRIDRRHPQ